MPYLYTIIACVLCMGIGFFLGMLYHHSAVCDDSEPVDEVYGTVEYAKLVDGPAAYPSNTLEKVIANIQEHDRLHPDHGVGCACHDVHAGMIRRLYQGVNEKSKRNLMVVLGYVTRSP